jgi:hypothetical protein
MTTMRAGARGRSRGLRVFALAFALLQIGLQGTFAVSDGYAEQASSHIAPVHAEIPGNHHHRLHDSDCVVCHVLATGSTVPPRPVPAWLDAERVSVAPSTEIGARPYAVLEGARLARSPPATV